MNGHCTNCDTKLPQGAAYCTRCGQSVGQYCTSCGTQMLQGAAHCARCGSPLSPGGTTRRGQHGQPTALDGRAPARPTPHERLRRPTSGKMQALNSLYGTFNVTKFWVVSVLITVVSAGVLPSLLAEISQSSEPGDTLLGALLILIAVFGVCLLPFGLWQQVQRKRFFRWLEANWASFETGVMHPEGYVVSLDTKLIQYKVVFSAILATVSFESRPYALEHRSAGAAQITFTVLSAVFGWWFLGLDGVVETSKAIHGNTRNRGVFTLRELVEGSSAES